MAYNLSLIVKSEEFLRSQAVTFTWKVIVSWKRS